MNEKNTNNAPEVEQTMATMVTAVPPAGEAQDTPSPAPAPAPAAPPVVATAVQEPVAKADKDSQAAKANLQPGQMLGKCKIIRELGRGGMGAVYLAQHQTLDVPVAVKILPPDIASRDPQFAERFMREAKLACRIKHANVIAVMDADRDDKTGLYMIIQEFIDGGTVRDLIKKGPLTEAQALDIIAGVTEALIAAADFGIVHRDIKPDNIMLTRKGVVKLADLGIAKEKSDEEAGLTMSHVMMGTPAYMAPEQASDAKNVDARADIYSLGATFYHMLCGSAPYSGDTAYAVLTKLATAPTPDPRQKNPAISEGTARLVMRMMDKERDNRPVSAAVLLTEINSLRKPESSSTSDLQKMAQDLITEMRAIRDSTVSGTASAPAQAGKSKSKARMILAAAALLVALLAAGALWKLRQPTPTPSEVGNAASLVSAQAGTGTASSNSAQVPNLITTPVTNTGTSATTVPATAGSTTVAMLTPGIGTTPVTPPAVNLAELRQAVDGMLRKALDEQTLATPDVRSMFENPVRFVRSNTNNIDPALLVKELVEKRIQIQDVFALLGKPRVGINIAETVVGKDGLASRDSRIDRFRTALKNEMENKYGLFVVDVTGDRSEQKTQCDILITGDVETAYFGEAVPPELAALGGTTPIISYNTALKVRFLNAVTNQDIASSVMDFAPKGQEQYCGMSHGDAIKNSIKGAIDSILPEWMNKVETSWVNLRTVEAKAQVE